MTSHSIAKISERICARKMSEMTEKEYTVYIKEVNWWSTTVTAACEEDAKVKAEEEHNTFEDYDGHGSSLTFLTEMAEMENEAAALRAKVAKLEAELKDMAKQSLTMLNERRRTIEAHEKMLELLGTRVEKTETKINYISMEAEGDEDKKSDEDTDTGGAA